MSPLILRLDQLPHLLKLLDDPSPRVHAKVRDALGEFGAALRPAVAACGLSLNAVQRAHLEEILVEIEVEEASDFVSLWQQVSLSQDEYFKIESALAFLSRWQFELEKTERLEETNLRTLLGTLSREYLDSGEAIAAEPLAQWLFADRLRGASAENYYSPLNSNLVHVLESGEGLPISLTLVFMLIGRRVGLEIHGCAFPGHFLARCGDDFFDCYDGGRRLEEIESDAVQTAMESAPESAPASLIIGRVLANIANAYQFRGDRKKVQAALSLLEQLRAMEDDH